VVLDFSLPSEELHDFLKVNLLIKSKQKLGESDCNRVQQRCTGEPHKKRLHCFVDFRSGCV
jgi:hypothetical protein